MGHLNTHKVDPLEAIRSANNIAEAFWKRASDYPDSPVYSHATRHVPGADPSWSTSKYKEVASKVARLASFLHAKGVRPGARVGIVSNTRPEWCIADLAILTLGGVTVSVYQSLTAHDAGFVIFDSLVRILFVENQEQLDKVKELLVSPCPIPAREDQPEGSAQLSFDCVVAFEKVEPHPLVIQLESIINDSQWPTSISSEMPKLSRDTLASLVYTSGTTGPPKGVMQTHGNHLANVWQATASGVFPLEGSLFLFLPLAHSFARLAYYIGFLSPLVLNFPAVADQKTSKTDLSAVALDLKRSSSTVIPSVPRLFEKMAAGIQAKADLRGFQSKILKLAIKNAATVYEKKERGAAIGILDQIVFQGMQPVRDKITIQLFGSNFSHAISGGAKLDPTVCRFFDSLGIKILEGYGLTETCVATNVNLPNRRRIGSVGPAFPEVEIKISPEDGEILIRGPNVTKEYWNRPQATKESFQSDGWFRTGDIGRIDEDGFLYITDRKKDLIVTAGGKKIPPLSVESRFQTSPYISHVILYGDGKPYCVALITLNNAEVRQWLHSHHPSQKSTAALNLVPEVVDLVKREVHAVNENLASFESIKRFSILEEELSIDNGFLTPTLKVKRKKVIEAYKARIEELYNSQQ